MQTIRDLISLRKSIAALRATGGTVALVPTMGALHEGHLTLVREAQAHADHVVASIFVNPAQFGPKEDLSAYPRREAEDAALLEREGTAILWAPPVSEVYPDGYATNVSVSGVAQGLCGDARPGHFDGVATVVAKLFNQVQPDVALFGEKDWQQLAVIRRMARDLDFALTIIGVPTVREADGLAMSSRNAYLSKEEREKAAMLPVILRAVAAQLRHAFIAQEILNAGRDALTKAGFGPIDYLEMRDADTLALLDRYAPGARVFVAARMGRTRLIDNKPVGSQQEGQQSATG